MHFILVDDDRMTLFFHDRLIRYHGLSSHIDSFCNPVDALDYISTNQDKISLNEEVTLLVDIEMPEMNGFDFVEKLETVPAAVLERFRIFMISASLDYTNLNRAESTPLIKGAFAKPLNIDSLREMMEISPE